MLELRAIRKAFGAVRALKDVTLDVARGEFVCVLGPSGCGKSTLLSAISGFVRPDAGEITIDGVSTVGLPPHQRPTAMVFQNYALFPHLDVFSNIAFGLRIRRQDRDAIGRKVTAALDLVKLPDVASRFPRQLSGGQQQRVALARALVVDPKVLLLDEPLSNLDAKLRELMRMELKELQRRLGITTLFVTHDQEEAFELGDRVVVMDKGRVEQIGTATDLYDRPRTMFVATFIGRANILEGRIVRRVSDGAIVTVAGLDVRVTVKDGDAGDRIRLLLRPEQITLASERPHSPNTFEGVVRWATHLGGVFRYVVDVGSLSLAALQSNTGQGVFAAGKQVVVAFGTDLRVLPLEDGGLPSGRQTL